VTATDSVPVISTIPGPGGCLPTPLQELLLDAALGDRDQASAAFGEWVAATAFEEIDYGSFRLLPLAAHNLERLGIATTWSAHLRGALRRSWYENQVMLHAALPAVDVLQSAGIDVIVFKGAALAALEYRGLDVRPMDDLDVLVPEDRAAEAMRALLDAGWEPGVVPLPEPIGTLPESFRRFRHGAPLVGPAGFDVDLHWHAAEAWCWPGADRGLWATTRPLELQGRQVRALAPGDELVLACVHGLHWNPVPPMRWVADAVTVIRSEAIAWPRLVQRARELLVEPQLVLAFEYLRHRFEAPVPEWVMRELHHRRPGHFERAWLDSLLHGRDMRSLAAHYGRYLRGARTDSGLRRWAGGLPDHLVHLLGSESTTQLPAEIGRRATARIRHRRNGGRAPQSDQAG
jgi:hypothetical protein